jgi:hypothetical protein
LFQSHHTIGPENRGFRHVPLAKLGEKSFD